MNKIKKEQTQLEKANEALLKLVPNITTNDRKEAESLVHTNTISIYLNGKGKDTDTAVKLLEFFRKKIEDREKQIA